MVGNEIRPTHREVGVSEIAGIEIVPAYADPGQRRYRTDHGHLWVGIHPDKQCIHSLGSVPPEVLPQPRDVGTDCEPGGHVAIDLPGQGRLHRTIRLDRSAS